MKRYYLKNRSRNTLLAATLVVLSLTCGHAIAAEKHAAGAKPAGPACELAGPQTPRDIDSKAGSNKVTFDVAPKYQDLNLCNIHFHNHAEHKAADYAIYAGDGDLQAACGRPILFPTKIVNPAPSAQCPRRTLLRQWAHAAAMSDVSSGAIAAVSESASPRDPAAGHHFISPIAKKRHCHSSVVFTRPRAEIFNVSIRVCRLSSCTGLVSVSA